MTGQGEVKALQGRDGYGLRTGSYRVTFDEDATTVPGDRHRPPGRDDLHDG
jgi:hypothetical protein